MSRLEKLDKTSLTNNPICGPYAVHALTGRSLPFVVKQYVKKWPYYYRRQRIPAVSGGTSFGHTPILLRERFKLKVTRERFEDAKTVQSFVENHTVKREKFLVHVCRHWVAVIDGKVVDQNSAAPVRDHWCRLKRPTHIYRIGTKR